MSDYRDDTEECPACAGSGMVCPGEAEYIADMLPKLARLLARLDICQDDDGSIHDEIDRLTAALHNTEFDLERKSEAVARLEGEVERLRGLAQVAASIIETADIRASAVDGPVSHCRDEMTDAEWRKLYLAVKDAARQALEDES